MYFQTTFGIRDPSERRLRGNRLLDAVRVLTEENLTLGPNEAQTEALSSANASYWELTVERPTLDASGTAVRLELRAYSREDRVRAQIVTRYLRTDTPGQQELPTFPPSLLSTLARRFDCITGCTRIGQNPRTVNRYNIRRFLSDQALNPRRTIPILIMTHNRRGNLEADPHRLQRVIAGTGQVVVMERGTENPLREAIGRATYNGKMRLLNPRQNGRHEYYDQQPELRKLVSQCLNLAKEPRFDAPFTQTARLVQEQDQSPIPATLTPNGNHEAEERIAELSRQNQALRERLAEIEATPPPPPTPAAPTNAKDRNIRLEASGTHNVTVMNHAINVARDPLRRYVVGRLTEQFGQATPEKIIATIDMRHTNSRQVRERPEACLDINDLANVVSNYQQCFNHDGVAAPELARLLREVKSIRNRASHPPLGGIDRSETIDKLHLIQQVMEYANISEHQQPIRELIQTQNLP